MHQKRLASLTLLVQSALLVKKLSVTALGRGIPLRIKERSGIRRADRLVGNTKLHQETNAIYQQWMLSIIGSAKRPKILIDWSQIPNTTCHMLKAALAYRGRAITLYDEVYEETYLNNAKIELTFLATLKRLLPTHISPIIITDAGFRIPWFKKVVELGWNYIGRVRGTPSYCNDTFWLSCQRLLAKATLGCHYVGELLLGKTNPLLTHLYLIKQKPQHRQSTRRKAGGKRDEYTYQRAGKEAWLLASSLPGKSVIHIKRVKKLYRLRMQIEQSFRDIKSHHMGLGLRNAYSRKPQRIRLLLLIAMMALWVAGLVGCYLEKHLCYRDFQSNSTKKRRINSMVYVGFRAIERGITLPTLKQIWIELSEAI